MNELMNSSDPVTKKAVVRPALGASDTATHGYSQKHVPASLACAEVPTLFFYYVFTMAKNRVTDSLWHWITAGGL